MNGKLSGDSVLVGVNDENNIAPEHFTLSQNYPNPFNPTTEISYTLNKSGFVTLKVFDVLGREITSLINEYKNPGTYNVTFNAKDIPSGVYFYSLDVNGFSSVKKMTIIK